MKEVRAIDHVLISEMAHPVRELQFLGLTTPKVLEAVAQWLRDNDPEGVYFEGLRAMEHDESVHPAQKITVILASEELAQKRRESRSESSPPKDNQKTGVNHLVKEFQSS